jgi:hypothetical protein
MPFKGKNHLKQVKYRQKPMLSQGKWVESFEKASCLRRTDWWTALFSGSLDSGRMQRYERHLQGRDEPAA